MFYQLLSALDRRLGIPHARAHCDVPCGIYDPIIAQIAALTVVRMIDLMTDLESKTADKTLAYHNTLGRHIAVKEEHAEKVKHEVRVIWGDYLKVQHLEKYPQAHALVHEIMALGSKCRQTVDREAAVKLVEKLNELAQIFWETKNVAVKRATAPYAPNLELVYPAL
jgi:nickel superoxide dismutase